MSSKKTHKETAFSCPFNLLSQYRGETPLVTPSYFLLLLLCFSLLSGTTLGERERSRNIEVWFVNSVSIFCFASFYYLGLLYLGFFFNTECKQDYICEMYVAGFCLENEMGFIDFMMSQVVL